MKDYSTSFLTRWERVIKAMPSRSVKPLTAERLYMPDDLIVALNRDADEAGDYRVMKHSEAVNNPNWTICDDISPSDLD